MKLFEKIRKDVESAKKKGYTVAVSYGSYQTFCKLKKFEPTNFDENLAKFNEYLNPHGLAVVRTKKGLRYTRLKSLKEYSKKPKKDDSLEL